jgi:hypothetical protein
MLAPDLVDNRFEARRRVATSQPLPAYLLLHNLGTLLISFHHRATLASSARKRPFVAHLVAMPGVI